MDAEQNVAETSLVGPTAAGQWLALRGPLGMAALALLVLLTVGLVAMTVVLTRRSAIEAACRQEHEAICKALADYQRGSSYPPTFGRADAAQLEREVLHHLLRRFPFYLPRNYRQFAADVRIATNLNVDDLDAAESLVFWLGGLPRQGRLTAFAYDRNKPVQSDLIFPKRTLPWFAFEPSRLGDADKDGWFEYYPPDGAPEQTAPYVYFNGWDALDPKGRSIEHYEPLRYAYPALKYPIEGAVRHEELVARWGLCSPARLPGGTLWYNDGSFHLITAGPDGKFGPATWNAGGKNWIAGSTTHLADDNRHLRLFDAERCVTCGMKSGDPR